MEKLEKKVKQLEEKLEQTTKSLSGELAEVKAQLVEKDTERQGVGWDQARQNLEQLNETKVQLRSAEDRASQLETTELHRQGEMEVLQQRWKAQCAELQMLRQKLAGGQEGDQSVEGGVGPSTTTSSCMTGEPGETTEVSEMRAAIDREFQRLQSCKMEKGKLEATLDATRTQLSAEETRRRDAEARIDGLTCALSQAEHDSATAIREARSSRFSSAAAADSEATVVHLQVANVILLPWCIN